MFNRKFKVVVYAVGLVAMVVGLMLPGIGQTEPGGCPPGPVPCIDRAKLVQGLQNAFAGLTASTEDLLDLEQAVAWSDGGPRFMAYIPPHPASGILDRLRQLRAGEKVDVPLGGLYVGIDATGRFPQGVYKIRLREDKALFINATGDVIVEAPAMVDKNVQLPEKLERIVFTVSVRSNPCFTVVILALGIYVDAHWAPT